MIEAGMAGMNQRQKNRDGQTVPVIRRIWTILCEIDNTDEGNAVADQEGHSCIEFVYGSARNRFG